MCFLKIKSYLQDQFGNNPTTASSNYLDRFENQDENELTRFDGYIYNKISRNDSDVVDFRDIVFVASFNAGIQKTNAWSALFKNKEKFIISDKRLVAKEFYQLEIREIVELSNVIRECDKIRFVSFSVATKILHMRYPKIMPILDSKVQKYINDSFQVNVVTDLEEALLELQKDHRHFLDDRYCSEFVIGLNNKLKKVAERKTKQSGILSFKLSKIRVYDLVVWDLMASDKALAF